MDEAYRQASVVAGLIEMKSSCPSENSQAIWRFAGRHRECAQAERIKRKAAQAGPRKARDGGRQS